MKEEGGGLAAHSETLRALNLQPPKIRSHLDLLSDPLAPLRAPTSPAPHSRLVATRSLRGVFQSRLSGPLGSLQPLAATRTQSAAVTARSPRALKRLSARHARPPRARSEPATDKENFTNFEDEEDEGFEDVWAVNGRDEARSVVSGRDTAADTRWAGDLTRLSSALDQLAALCNATNRSQSAPESALLPPPPPISKPSYPHHVSSVLAASTSSLSTHAPPNPPPANPSPTCPVHGTNALIAHTLLAAQRSNDGGRASPKNIHPPLRETDSGGSSTGHLASDPPSPNGGSSGRDVSGVAKRVGVVLRAFGGRLVAWSRGSEGTQASTQLSSSSSSSSSPTTDRHSGKLSLSLLLENSSLGKRYNL